MYLLLFARCIVYNINNDTRGALLCSSESNHELITFIIAYVHLRCSNYIHSLLIQLAEPVKGNERCAM